MGIVSPKSRSRCQHGIKPLNPNGLKNEDIIDCSLQVINKAGHQAYVATTKHGEFVRLRRVSRIIDTLGNSDGIVKWSAQMASSYVDQMWDVKRRRRYTEGEKQFILANAAEYHDRYKNETAELGKEAHEWIDKFFKTGAWPGPDDILDPRVVNSLELFAEKWKSLGWQVLESEFYVWDVELEYGGTLDVLAWDPKTNTYIVIDLKTGSGIYANHLYQVSAYVGAANRMGTKGYPVSKAFVLRIGREDAFPHLMEIEPEELEEGYEIFKVLCTIQRSVSKLDSRYYNRKLKWEEEHRPKHDAKAPKPKDSQEVA